MDMIVIVTDNMGRETGYITDSDIIAFTFTDEANALDRVDITTRYELRGGDRLIWRDEADDARFHEHICLDPFLSHGPDGMLTSCTAVNSFRETSGDYIEDIRPGGAAGSTWHDVLGTILDRAGTRWEPGTSDALAAGSHQLSFYHTNALKATGDLFEAAGIGFRTEVYLYQGKVSGRSVVPLDAESVHGVCAPVRFEYGLTMDDVKRTYLYDPITACYGYGAGLPTEGGGYTRKLTFTGLNGGCDYLEDAGAKALYGRPQGSGVAHVFGVYENPDCEDAAQLMAETRDYLNRHKVPGVSYEMDAELLSTERNLYVGQEVQIVDRHLTPELRTTGRVSRVVTDMTRHRSKVTVGTTRMTLADMFGMVAKGIRR